MDDHTSEAHTLGLRPLAVPERDYHSFMGFALTDDGAIYVNVFRPDNQPAQLGRLGANSADHRGRMAMAMKIADGIRHTPGPWRNENGKVYSTIDESDYLIADASGDSDLTLEASEANAELIADAPRILRLLQTAYGALRSYQLGNVSTELAQQIADRIEPFLARHTSGGKP
jgi:hypothetical protein